MSLSAKFSNLDEAALKKELGQVIDLAIKNDNIEQLKDVGVYCKSHAKALQSMEGCNPCFPFFPSLCSLWLCSVLGTSGPPASIVHQVPIALWLFAPQLHR